MAAKKDPNLGINYGWALGEDNWKDGMDANLLLLGAILNLQVTAIQNAPPTGTLTNGMRYIVGTAPTGAWAGKANQVAVLVEASWTFWAPKAGWCAQVESTASEWLYTGTAWQNKVAAVADVSAGTAPDILLASIGGVKALLDSAGFGAYLNDTSNLNNATKNGFFAWNNTSTNAPVASSYGRGYTIASDANNATQYGIVNATGAMYVRFLTAGAWGAWTKVGASSAGDVGALPLTNTSLGTTDLNTLGAPDSAGVYPQTNSANATSARNYPEVVAGTLLVTPSAYSGCQQMYTTITGNVWVRALTGTWSASSPTWGTWVKISASDALTSIGLGLSNQTPIEGFDWQQADFVSGSQQIVNFSSSLNPPAGISYNTGTTVTIEVVQVRGVQYTLRLTGHTGSPGNRREYVVFANGNKGSRGFQVNQKFNSDSSTVIPLANGGLGATTPAGGRKTLGFEDLGFGVRTIPLLSTLDWQTLDILSGQVVRVSSGNMSNIPAAAGSFGTGVITYFRRMGDSNDTRQVWEIWNDPTPDSASRRLQVIAVGAAGSRTFIVRDIFMSTDTVPVKNGGTGGKTLSEAQAVLGINPAFLNAVADLNTALLNAPFAWLNTSTNSPVAGSYGRGITIASDATNVTQIGIINDTGAMYVRYLVGTTWSAWISTTVTALPYLVYSNPGTTPFPAAAYTAIPFYTSGETAGGITLTSNATITVPAAGLYDFELEVRVNGGATNMPPVGTVIGLSIDTTTVPTSLRAGYSAAQAVDSVTILRLHCRERLAAGATRRAYLYNAGAAGYQVTSAVIKVTRVGA